MDTDCYENFADAVLRPEVLLSQRAEIWGKTNAAIGGLDEELIFLRLFREYFEGEYSPIAIFGKLRATLEKMQQVY